MTRIAFTGDSHFDGSPNGRLKECVDLHDWMVNDWRSQGVRLVLHGGDLFEGLGATHAVERLAAAKWLQNAAMLGPVLIVRGNHDPLGELPLYARLDAVNPILVAEEIRMVRFEAQDVEVVCVPWPRKGLGVRIDRGDGEEHDVSDLGLDVRESIRRMMTHYGSKPRKCSRRIVVSHAMIAGATTSTGQPLVGTDCEIAVEDLALADPDVILLSHVHARQAWRVGTPSGRVISAHYAGSPRRTDWGERESKSYLLLSDIETTERREVYVRSIDVPAPAMLHEEWTWKDGSFEVGEGAHDWSAQPEGTRIRVRATIPTDQRDAARRVMETITAEAMLRSHELTWEEIPVVVQRARAPEIAEAASIDAKCELAWKALNVELQPDRVARLRKLAIEIDDQAARDPRVARSKKRGGIRMLELRGVGIGPLQEFGVNFQTLKGPVVAVCGANEAGKSTFLESIVGLLYRTTVTRDPLLQLATGAKSVLYGRFEMGGECFYANHVMDKVHEKAMATVTNDSLSLQGKEGALTPHAKVTEFDEWVKTNMPPLEVFLASQFTAQGETGFLGLGAAKRKELVQQALGIDGIEARASLARALRDAAQRDRDSKEAELKGLLGRGVGKVDELQKALDDAVFHVEQTRGAAATADEAVERLVKMKEEGEAAYVAWRDAAAERGKLLDQCARLEADARTAHETLESARLAAARLPMHKEARKQADSTRQKIAACRAGRDDMVKRVAELRAKASSSRAAIARLQVDRDNAIFRVNDCKRLLVTVNELRALADRADDLERVAQENSELYRKQKAAHDELKKKRSEFGHQRADKLKHGHLEIVAMSVNADGLENAQATAQRAIDADDEGLRAAKPEVERDAARAEAAASDLRDASRNAAENARRARDRMVDLGDVAGRLTAAEADEAAAVAALNATAPETLEPEIARLDAERVKYEKLIAELEGQLRAIDNMLRTEHSDEEKAAQVGPLEARFAKLTLDATTIKQTLLLTPSTPPAPSRGPSEGDVLLAREGAKACQRRHAAAAEQRAGLETLLKAAREADAQAQELRLAIDIGTVAIADLTLLATTFGRDGIQALEVDAAGPELSAIVNDLLHSCFGTRWTVRIDTTRPLKRDPSRSEEVFDVRVIDGKTGIERSAQSNSGGAKVPISEAISMALTVIACRRNAADRPTIVRDESGAALDAENAKAYVAMLRRAAERIGAEHVLLVSHNPAVWELADSRVRVGGGTIEVS